MRMLRPGLLSALVLLLNGCGANLPQVEAPQAVVPPPIPPQCRSWTYAAVPNPLPASCSAQREGWLPNGSPAYRVTCCQ